VNTSHRSILLVWLSLLAAMLAACAAPPRPSTALQPALAGQGLTLVRSLPTVLPNKAVPVPHAQWVLIPGESAAGIAVGLLMPIPFVTEAIGAAMDRSAAEAFEARYAAIAPYRIAQEAWRGSPFVRAEGGALTLQPFVFMAECVDDRFRLALVFHLQGGSWVGRYMYHLPTTYSVQAFNNPSAEVLASVRQELETGAAALRQLVERAARGELKPSGVRADVGSLHWVGGRAAGLVSPNIVISKDADVIEETADHVVVRLPGDMALAGTLGGLFFGVHYLRKDQLLTFRKH
jgi:hypothetical protein